MARPRRRTHQPQRIIVRGSLQRTSATKSARNGHGAMSDLSPLYAEQRTLPLPCALVLYISLNDGPETLTCAKARCAIVVRFGHAVVRVMQQRAGEVRIGATMDGSTGGDSGAEQVRADGDA